MRKINHIVIHASATKEGEFFNAADIEKWHKKRGFKTIGYHYVVLLDGTVEKGRPDEKIGAHVKDFNKDSIGIVYIGGLDKNRKPKDTRTEEQKTSLLKLLKELKAKHRSATISGHRDFSPDLNKNGIIEKHEFIKACPCYDAKKEYQNV